MAIKAEARVVVRGGSEALKTLQGLRRETTQAGKAAKAAATSQAKAEKSELQQRIQNANTYRRIQEQTARRVSSTQAREASRAARTAEREARRVTRTAQVEAAKQERSAKKLADEQETAATRARKSRGRLLGAVTAGVVAGASTAFSTARGIAGQRDIKDRVRTGLDFRERFIVSSTQAGVTGKQAAAAQASILAASNATGVDQMDLLGAVERGQSEFNAFQGVADNIGTLAEQAKGAGIDVASFTSAVLRMQQAFGLADKDIKKTGDLILASASAGAIEAGNIATDFAPTAGLFAQNTGHMGEAGLREFLGTAQAMGTLGAGSAESATMTENFLNEINKKDVQKKLRRIGVSVTNKDGTMRGFQDIVTDLAGNKKFQSANVRQEIFAEKRARVGVEALMGATKRVQAGTGTVDIGTIAGVDSAEGEKKTKEVMAALASEGLLDIQRESARMQSDVIANLRSYSDQVRALQRVSNALEAQFGPLALQADAAKSALAGLTLTALATGGFRGGGGGGGPAGTVGSAIGNAASVIAIGAATFTVTSAVLNILGLNKPLEDAGSSFFDATHPGDPVETQRTKHRALKGDQAAAVAAYRESIGEPTFDVIAAGRPGTQAPYLEGKGPEKIVHAVFEVTKEMRKMRDDVRAGMRDRPTQPQRGPR